MFKMAMKAGAVPALLLLVFKLIMALASDPTVRQLVQDQLDRLRLRLEQGAAKPSA